MEIQVGLLIWIIKKNEQLDKLLQAEIEKYVLSVVADYIPFDSPFECSCVESVDLKPGELKHTLSSTLAYGTNTINWLWAPRVQSRPHVCPDRQRLRKVAWPSDLGPTLARQLEDLVYDLTSVPEWAATNSHRSGATVFGFLTMLYSAYSRRLIRARHIHQPDGQATNRQLFRMQSSFLSKTILIFFFSIHNFTSPNWRRQWWK